MKELCITILMIVLQFFGFTGLRVMPESVQTDIMMATATVVAVIDGDTIEVLQTDGRKQKVRYIGIDTPEPYRDGEPACYSKEATRANAAMVEGKRVQLVSDTEDTDKYGRLLRYVYTKDVFVNAKLVEDGFAKTLRIKPNTEHANTFFELQTNAKEAKRGMWGVCK